MRRKAVRETIAAVGIGLLLSCGLASARDAEYNNTELPISVAPGEPTQVTFPGRIAGGFRKKVSTLSLEHKGSDLVIFANEGIGERGEAIIVRLEDGRSYSLRIARASSDRPRDDVVSINDARGALLASASEDPAYLDKNFDYAPATKVAGLMRELILAAEFGKDSIPGYRVSTAYRGQPVFNDGTLSAKIDKIFMGPNLWGYVLDAENLVDQTQKINPASFRIDGTRAVSMRQWELSPLPLTAEQQIAGKHKTKVYIITKSKR